MLKCVKKLMKVSFKWPFNSIISIRRFFKMILSTLQVLIQYNLALLFFSRVSLLLSSCLMEKLFSHVARTVASVRLVSGLLNKI